MATFQGYLIRGSANHNNSPLIPGGWFHGLWAAISKAHKAPVGVSGVIINNGLHRQLIDLDSLQRYEVLTACGWVGREGQLKKRDRSYTRDPQGGVFGSRDCVVVQTPSFESRWQCVILQHAMTIEGLVGLGCPLPCV